MEKKGSRLYKKRSNWNEKSESALLDLWGENITGLRGARKNSHVHAEMSQSMKELGVPMTAQEIRIKIKNMTAKYRAEKALIGASGGQTSAWCHYDRVKEILGAFPCENAESFAEDGLASASSISSPTHEDNTVPTQDSSPDSDASAFSWSAPDPPSTSSSSCISPAGRNKKNNYQMEMVQHLQEIGNRVESYTQESVALEREGLALFKDFLQQTADFNKQILELFKSNK